MHMLALCISDISKPVLVLERDVPKLQVRLVPALQR